MKPVPFLFALCLGASAPLLAAPAATAPAPPTNPADVGTVVPQIDAGAVALLDESVKAYAALTTLSQKFEIVDKLNGAVQPAGSGRGTLQIQKPGSARLELKMGDKSMLYLSDGATLIAQAEPTSYQKATVSGDTIGRVVAAIPSAANLPLSRLLGGQSPLDGTIRWQKAVLTSMGAMKGVAMDIVTRPGSEPVTFRVFLDPKTNLVARVEASGAISKKVGVAPDLYSNVTTFAPDATPIVPATFNFVPAPGVKLAQQAERKTYDAALVVGAQPFALVGKTLEGQSLSLDSYKGKVVLLDFWATWCGPCIGELPNVKANYDKYKPQGFDIVAVSLDEEEADLRNFVKERKLPWPQIFDGKGWEAGNAQLYGVRAIPFTLLVGKDGKIAAVNPRGEELEPAIKAALAK